ncbi:surface lipoprotein assembly modifier [Lutimaribacter saemankumensis]|uniref:Tetratricopeptide repeat-containing protein n=1 Tax=Lutimaribacter saemankumensis TaxID=490829 RepID=A0A1G8MKN3_9RHOB|nr:surface lipoprotein assembly modifier [Lutimaribacter saemankumensis]SDI68598.1 Protein of unknown function [Lutimaribacter saemankumensis]
MWLRLAVLCATLMAQGAQASTVEMTPDELRGIALQSLEQGRPDQAAVMAEALRARDGGDVDALLIGARAYRDLGQLENARRWARAAWRHSDTAQERHASALVMAQALASSDLRIPAQLWLRRAIEHAPDEASRARAARDFKYVRSRTPLSFQIIAGISPNSNVNNGSTTGESTFFDPFTRQFVEVELGGAALALSGVEQNIGFALRYRFGETPMRATDVTLAYDYRTYKLSDAAKALAPGVKGSDFRTSIISGGLTQRWRLPDRSGEVTLGAHLGTMDYGGQHYADFGSVKLGATRVMSPTLRLGGTLSSELTRGPRAPHADAGRLDLFLQQALAEGGVLTWRLELGDSRSDSSNADYSEIGMGVSFAPPNPFWGVDLDYGLSLRMRDYDTSPFSADGRQDQSAIAHVTATFREVDFYGFVPTVTLRAERNLSNIGLYESDRIATEFGVRSAF